MNCNIIGAGRLGKNIALALSQAKLISIAAVCNSDIQSAREACKAIGSGQACDSLEHLPPVDITWITTRDDTIPEIVTKIAKLKILKPGSLFIHCSGVLDSSMLSPLKSQDCSIASFHPLKAFRQGYLNAQAFAQIHCVLEGDAKACDWLRHSFSKLGAKLITIKPEAKATYHAAAAMASNYLLTLASCSEELLLKAGLTHQQAREMICSLMQGNLNNLEETTPIAQVLTGPIMRGDSDTVSLHLKAIDNPIIKAFYKAAGIATLPLTQLEENKKINMEKILD